MKEKVFNLFLIGDEKTISQIGCMTHILDGSDEEKRAFLSSRVEEDLKTAERLPLKTPISWEYNHGTQRIKNDISLFEPFFQEHNAPSNPFSVRTAVVNEKIKIDRVHWGDEPLPLHGSEADNEHFGKASFDYLSAYIKDGNFDVIRLLYDDHYEAVKILFNQGKLVSSLKLLMIFIDTIGFLEFGYHRGPRNFIMWLDSYADLSALGITSAELWEFRNGVLHMTNTESDKNREGHVDRLIPRISTGGIHKLPTVPGFKHFEALDLIQAVGNAVAKWVQTLNEQREKFPEFITRYDTLMSDTRRLYFKI